MSNIDRKYKIQAINPCSLNMHSENDSVLFLAKDKALPDTIEFYRNKCIELGANQAHMESIALLRERVIDYQLAIEAKTPDTDLPCEIRRCIDGIGVDTNTVTPSSLANYIEVVANKFHKCMDDITAALPLSVAPFVINEASGLPEKKAEVLQSLVEPINDLYQLVKLLNPESTV